MKLINKHNFINVLCITYTIISLFACIFESIIYKEISHDHFNMLLMFILSIVSILVLSQHYRFDNIPTLILIIIQYIVALLCTTIIMLFLSNFIEVSTGGYKDMFISFSILYLLGTIIYYITLKIQVNKQNKVLKEIKKEKLKLN